jgi:hypothetical protein
MANYIATEAVIPLRSSPSESSEMVSQILFGERLTGGEVKGNWVFVKNEDDGYEGWLTKYMVVEIPEHLAKRKTENLFVCQQGIFLKEVAGAELYLPMGARLPVGDSWEKNGQLKIGERTWDKPDMGLISAHPANDPLAIAQAFLNVPYLWGGRSSYGIDCSGLTQFAFRVCNRFLPRDSGQQWREGEQVSWEVRQPGDLAFFTKKNETKVTHVGLIMHGNEIIHASGRVRIDELKEEGIVNKENKKLSHHLLGIKKYL